MTHTVFLPGQEASEAELTIQLLCGPAKLRQLWEEEAEGPRGRYRWGKRVAESLKLAIVASVPGVSAPRVSLIGLREAMGEQSRSLDQDNRRIETPTPASIPVVSIPVVVDGMEGMDAVESFVAEPDEVSPSEALCSR